MSALLEDGYLMRICIGEGEKKGGLHLYEWIVRRAQEEKLAGATVLRGIEGFGATAKILDLSTKIPIIIEIADNLEKINAFLPIVDQVVQDGIVTVEKVKIKLYRGKKR